MHEAIQIIGASVRALAPAQQLAMPFCKQATGTPPTCAFYHQNKPTRGFCPLIPTDGVLEARCPRNARDNPRSHHYCTGMIELPERGILSATLKMPLSTISWNRL